MTSKYYCPICGEDLHMTNDVFSICTNESCKIRTLPIPNAVSDYLEQIAQALIQSQQDLEESQQATLENAQTVLEIHKDLEIATKALEEIRDETGEDRAGFSYVVLATNMKGTAENALGQIEHKEI